MEHMAHRRLTVLALDTTSRGGSVALWRDGRVVATVEGDPSRTHAERLPQEFLDLLARHGVTVPDIDVYGVAAGPGSFTGLRVGIATIQGLALVNDRRVVPVSALDALAGTLAASGSPAPGDLIAAWIDAQRREVFAALYRYLAPAPEPAPHSTAGATSPEIQTIDPPSVAPPAAVLDRWRPALARPTWFAGTGAVAYRDLLVPLDRCRVLEPPPALAPAVARIAAVRAERGQAVRPHAVRPIYVRRPDAELARERRARSTGTPGPEP
jgi:tRNA threonylcarbamoyladenosine biosynthesis protein TsaB